MRRAAAALALALACTAPRAEQWADTDRALLATALALHVVDWGQTLGIVGDARFYERNPILGRHPSRGDVNAYFAGTTLLMVVLAGALPEYRRPLLWGYVAVGAIAVGNNLALGVRFGF